MSSSVLYDIETSWGTGDRGEDAETIAEQVRAAFGEDAWLEEHFPRLCELADHNPAWVKDHINTTLSIMEGFNRWTDSRYLVLTAVGELSRLYEDTLFGVRAWGEEFDDRWVAYYVRGREYQEQPRLPLRKRPTSGKVPSPDRGAAAGKRGRAGQEAANVALRKLTRDALSSRGGGK